MSIWKKKLDSFLKINMRITDMLCWKSVMMQCKQKSMENLIPAACLKRS